MQIAAKTNLFLTSLTPLKVFGEIQYRGSSGEFYQQIVKGLTRGLTNRHALRSYAEDLMVLAEKAYRLGRIDTVEKVSRILRSLPLSNQYTSVGSYYGAICIGRTGQVTEARQVFLRVAEEGSLGFRARSMMSLGGYFHKSGDFQLALPFVVEAARAAKHIRPFDPLVALGVDLAIAALKGDDGDHKRSLDDLERIFPLARMVGREYPPLMSDYLNSYAVELAAVGRLEEASNVSRIVLASTYANAYPEWRETFEEIAGRGLRPSRSLVGFCESASRTDNVVRLSEFGHTDETASSEPRLGIQPGLVIDIQNWKKTRVPKESKKTPRLSKEEIKAMTRGEKRATIGQLIYSESVSEEALAAIIAAAEEVIAKGKSKN